MTDLRAILEPQLKGKRLWLWLFLGFVALVLLILPPVWQLTYRDTIAITRWPKSGEEVVDIGPGKKHWVDISKVSRHVLNAIIVAEDSRFSNHKGLDFVEIRKSFETNLSQKRIVRGGSTITQQLVKMLFLSPDRTYTRKFREALGALLLEQLVDKKTILEWYINIIEFGDGVYGINDAAQHYFRTRPELLTIQQGANLALVIPSPNGWSVGLRRKELPDFGQKRYGHIIFQMFQNGFITKDLMLTALATGNFGKPVASYKKYRGAVDPGPYEPHGDPPRDINQPRRAAMPTNDDTAAHQPGTGDYDDPNDSDAPALNAKDAPLPGEFGEERRP